MTVAVAAIGMASIGAILLAASRGQDKTLEQIAITLEYAVCALLVINYFAYYYYSRKLGGRP